MIPSYIFTISSNRNLANMLTNIAINIFVRPDIVENILIVADCAQEFDIYTAIFKEFHDFFP